MGSTTDEVDAAVHERIIAQRAYPSPLNYARFPKSICSSVNNVACHGIPDDVPLSDGDIVKVDISVFYNGYHGDTCGTFLVGNVDEKGRKLVRTAEECLWEGIKVCKSGVSFERIGDAIQSHAEKNTYRVCPLFLGHGIGTVFHDSPEIFHTRNGDERREMRKGMCFTIEPVINEGVGGVEILADKWTAVTKDGKRSAQFEHTIHVTTEVRTVIDRS